MRGCVVHICTIGLVPKLFLIEHFRGMINAGLSVVLICCDDDEARDVVRSTGVRFIPVTIKQNTAPISGLLNMARLWWVLWRLRPEIVDSHGSKAGLVGILVSWLARIQIRIYHNHGLAMLSSRGFKRAFFRVVEKISCGLATRVIFVSTSNMRDAVAAGICFADKATVLGPGTIAGIDTYKFDPERNAVRGADLRRRAGIPENAWLCGFVGRIVPHKGVETILEAWKLLPPDIRARAYLCMFGALGTRPMYVLVERAVAQPDLHIRYMGFCEDLPAWYSIMTLLIQPSWHEGWGYNVLEAACSGVPTVGTRISATIDAVVEGETGVLVQVKDPKAMANAIAELLTDEDLRHRYGRAARIRTLAEFSQDKICPLLLDEYRRLLSELGRKREAVPDVR
jgi:glycosyltransferase involved in cell wall biosynthesis